MNRLKPFSYFEPTSLEEAVEILGEQGPSAVPFAGGTDLLVRMKIGLVRPSALINLKRIAGFDQIEMGKSGARIGALAKVAALESSDLIREQYPMVAQAAGVLGGPPVRSLATLGGNIGRASPASDMAPALLALDAKARVKGPDGERTLAVKQIFSGPGVTSLSPAELITSFELPPKKDRSGGVYLKIGRRQGMDCALVGVAAWLRLGEDDGLAAEVKIAFSSVGPTPLRSVQAEQALLSGTLTRQSLEEAAKVASEEITPMSDMRASESYRRQAARALTLRALVAALETAQKG